VVSVAAETWPTISIVIPSLNQGRFIEPAIVSVLSQEYPRLELIVMDGGSGDGTASVIEKYRPRLKHWVSQRDRGPADALNQGFAHATGDVMGVLNADDFFLPGCFAKMARAFAADPRADVVSGHGYFANASGELALPTFSDRWDLQHFRYGACVLVQPATFFRRSAFERVGGFRESGSLCWDMELWADMAKAGARFSRVDAFLAAFRLHPDSITARPEMRSRRRQHALAVLEKVRGRPASFSDRVLTTLHRFRKFSQHPARTLKQRMYFHTTLDRWSL
jgi:glycosyltransferase involved in cell wall biosynthesis